ncbi:uncharacterized protein PHACADRAFT_202087 [Phanerochaete carnosa HHB-10118-sp]|uniref:GOLD domain-containing protein n=1 Tax=Phanerochaete carnosa (strain HHB-10118-sp) TaxID=650164 RepID=K5WFR8_PHACS|nr:uncharacterized protein PHACADRAFT_202087 [Phanerochaete carnosa HHB-10118-sp]EKM49042.1 hypothetical protein PHACADRAFT_202087 [Phanerochaete carnosa HHB-10118-sp]
MKYNDVQVSVLVEDRVSDEYAIANESENTITCWIASEEGKEFKIKISNSSSSTALSSWVQIDVRLMVSSVSRPKTSSLVHGASISSTVSN